MSRLVPAANVVSAGHGALCGEQYHVNTYLRTPGAPCSWENAPGVSAGRRFVNQADAELVQRCLAGDREAWETLVQKYQSRVYNVAYHMTQDRERARDFAQEAFIQILRSFHRFRGEASLGTWIHGVTMRVCLHHLRRERRREADSWEELPAPYQDPPAPGGGEPGILAAQRETQRLVHEAVSRLEPKFRAVIVLHGLAGLTYEETAEALNLPVNTVKTRVHRAKAKLRILISAMLEGDEDAL